MSVDLVTRAAPAGALTRRQLNLMRVGYLVMGVGLVLVKWPLLVTHGPWELAAGTVECLLIALSVFALAGVRFPERMLPILVFEVTWKVVWLVLIALPMWRADALDEATITQLASMAWVIIIAAVIPWRWLSRQPLGRRGSRSR